MSVGHAEVEVDVVVSGLCPLGPSTHAVLGATVGSVELPGGHGGSWNPVSAI